MGSPESVGRDSITTGLLEHPVYTRPARYEGWDVPKMLLSGNHGEIKKWRREQALERTLRWRPDLLTKAELTAEDLAFLEGLGYGREG